MRYPIVALAEELADTHDVVSMVWSPEQGGYPSRRPRLFAAGIAKWSHVWVGVKPGQQVQQAFAAAFAREVSLDGDCFFFTDDKTRNAWIESRARNTKGPMLPENWKQLSGEDLLPYILTPHMVSRCTEWNHVFEEVRRSPIGGRAFLSDIDHYAGRGPQGHLFPVQLTHHTIFSWTQQKFATDSECWAAMGFDWDEAISGGHPKSPLHSVLSDKPSYLQAKLRGNSLHVPTVGAWLAFVMANTVRRADYDKLPAEPPLKQAADIDNDDELV